MAERIKGYSPQELRMLWEEFGDLPMNPETECMEAPFQGFPAGTHREEIWHWFDERYPGGVAALFGFSRAELPEVTKMTVRQLIEELQEFDGDLEVRVVDRNAGWDDSIYAVVGETYGIDSDTQMAILLN